MVIIGSADTRVSRRALTILTGDDQHLFMNLLSVASNTSLFVTH